MFSLDDVLNCIGGVVLGIFLAWLLFKYLGL